MDLTTSHSPFHNMPTNYNNSFNSSNYDNPFIYTSYNNTNFNNNTSYNNTTNSTEFCSHNIGHLNEVLALLRPSIIPIDRYFSLVWFLIGFPGNFISFFVWIRRPMRPSSGCYLAALALNDFLFLLIFVINELNTAWEKWVLNYPVVCEMFPVIFYTFQYLSPFLILAFTVERYISICHPYQRDKYCTTKRNIVVISCLVLYTLLMHSFQAYIWHFNSGTCDFRDSVGRTFRSILKWVCEIQAFAIVPLAITLLNVRVIVEIHRVNKRASKQQSNNHNHHPSNSATTATLLLVSFYYIISTLPVTICYIMVPSFESCLSLENIETDPDWQYLLNYWNTRVVVQELGASHYAFNIILYLLTGSQFRAETLLMFHKVCRCNDETSGGFEVVKKRFGCFGGSGCGGRGGYCGSGGCSGSSGKGGDKDDEGKNKQIKSGKASGGKDKRSNDNDAQTMSLKAGTNERDKYDLTGKSKKNMPLELNKCDVVVEVGAPDDDLFKNNEDSVKNPLLESI